MDRWEGRFSEQRRIDTEEKHLESETHSKVHWKVLHEHLKTSAYLTEVILPIFKTFAVAAKRFKYEARVAQRKHAAKGQDGILAHYTSGVQITLTRTSPPCSGSISIQSCNGGEYKRTTLTSGHPKEVRTETSDNLTPERVAVLLDELFDLVLGFEGEVR